MRNMFRTIAKKMTSEGRYVAERGVRCFRENHPRIGWFDVLHLGHDSESREAGVE